MELPSFARISYINLYSNETSMKWNELHNSPEGVLVSFPQRKVGCLATRLVSNKLIEFQISCFNKADKWDKKKARTIALARLSMRPVSIVASEECSPFELRYAVSVLLAGFELGETEFIVTGDWNVSFDVQKASMQWVEAHLIESEIEVELEEHTIENNVSSETV